MRVPYEEMISLLKEKLVSRGMDESRAELSARLFADASADGVHTHGLNRFPKYISMIDQGFIDVSASPSLESRIGVIERWNGNRGPGNLNAYSAMKRAIELAASNAMGVVTLRNTNHWMRAGNYGIEAVRNGCIGILWTNAMPNMPAWGARDARIGNNPMVLAVPYRDTPVIVDLAMSMFSYGKLERYALEGRECPVDGGFDSSGNLTRDPVAISESRQVLPMGYWKGSSLAIALDLIVSLISGGRTTKDIGDLPCETEVSQIFMAISLDAFPDHEDMERRIGETLSYIDSSLPREENVSIHYPGEGMKRTRCESMRLGVYAEDSVWEKVKAL